MRDVLTLGERGLEEPALCRHGYRLGAHVSAQLVENRMDVLDDCTLGVEKLVAMALLERPCAIAACGRTWGDWTQLEV